MNKEAIKGLFRKITTNNQSEKNNQNMYEFCPRCEANITLQKGYSNELPYWICKGCGEMLINPAVKADSDIAWICDGCGEMLNIQDGFNEDCGDWKCTVCGFNNRIDASKVYSTEDEYQADLKNPYKGLKDEHVLELSTYVDIENVSDREDIILVEDPENGVRYIKKYLTDYDMTVYEYLKENPIRHMPRIQALYKSDTSLIVIEEYIKGKTVADILKEGVIKQEDAISIAKSVCVILNDLHSLDTPIIHRDIKPSNIIVSEEGEVYLLDINVAKWYDPDKSDDTRYMGTQNYAAPEQVGFGFKASSAKTDIYALGVVLNEMITGEIPKEEKVDGTIWNIIERCISLDADNRYTAAELIKEFDEMLRSQI